LSSKNVTVVIGSYSWNNKRHMLETLNNGIRFWFIF